MAIVLPARGLAAASAADVDLDALASDCGSRVEPGAEPPAGVESVMEIEAGGEIIGYAFALAAARNGMPRVKVDREEILRTTTLAALAEVAVVDARDEVAADVRGSLLEDLRARRARPAETVSRAARLGCDLRRGAVALVAEVRSSRPRHAAALVTGEHDGAIAEPLRRGPGANATGRRAAPVRVYAILPARGGDDAADATAASAKAIATGCAGTARLRSRPSAPIRPSSTARSPRPS